MAVQRGIKSLKKKYPNTEDNEKNCIFILMLTIFILYQYRRAYKRTTTNTDCTSYKEQIV